MRRHGQQEWQANCVGEFDSLTKQEDKFFDTLDFWKRAGVTRLFWYHLDESTAISEHFLIFVKARCYDIYMAAYSRNQDIFAHQAELELQQQAEALPVNILHALILHLASELLLQSKNPLSFTPVWQEAVADEVESVIRAKFMTAYESIEFASSVAESELAQLEAAKKLMRELFFTEALTPSLRLELLAALIILLRQQIHTDPQEQELNKEKRDFLKFNLATYILR